MSGDDEARTWLDCELCSLVENRFHVPLAPAAVDDGARAQWLPRALERGESLVDPRRERYRRGYWLLDRGERAGTIGLATSMLGRRFLPVSSLYVFPERRGGGVAYAALRRLYDATVASGAGGIRLDTHWTWQPAMLRYVTRYGMWAWSFKRSIDLVWSPGLPPHRTTFDGDRAVFSVESDGRTVPLIEAGREGDRLRWDELPALEEEVAGDVAFYARSTFAVVLALEGWPLLQTPDEIDGAFGDIGGPAVLARRIAVFEWADRRAGFDVRTPRIPGLPYDRIARELDAPP